MAISPSPITEVHLLNVPLDRSYENQIYFNNASDQYNYFISKVVESYESYTYQRWNSLLKVEAYIDDIINCNYVMYQNEAGKWFYAFIKDINFIAPKTTGLVLEQDVYQTWLFDVTLLDSFVVREHVTDDTYGLHITDEGLDMGEYVRASVGFTEMLDNITIMVAVSYDKDLNTNQGQLYAGVYSGLSYLSFPPTTEGIASLNSFIVNLASVGKTSMIQSIFYMPTSFINTSSAKTYDVAPVVREHHFQGYTPKNNKLYCYPYSFLYVSNNQGSGAVYRYEFFDAVDFPSFKMIGDFSPSPTVYLIPTNYKGIASNVEEKLSITNFPICSWNNDIYTNWLAQNKNRLMTSTLISAGQVAGGIASENPIGIANGLTSVLGQMAQVMDRSIQPSQAMGNIGGNGAYSIGIQDFFFYPTTITREYAERIDKFFDMYGYKVNTVKKPNVSTRPYWNYVKTLNVNLKGDIPSNDLVKLKSMYNNGVTLWHGGDNVGNYSLNNH